VNLLEKTLTQDQFKLLVLNFQDKRKISKRKADADIADYLSRRTRRIMRRCGYFG